MNPIYIRLVEIARDQGVTGPIPNTYFQELLGVSSGRIAQIRKPGSRDGLGPDALLRLAMLGYSIEWVKTGHGDMRLYAAISRESQPKSAAAEVPVIDDSNRHQTLDRLIAALVNELSTEHEDELEYALASIKALVRRAQPKYPPEEIERRKALFAASAKALKEKPGPQYSPKRKVSNGGQ